MPRVLLITKILAYNFIDEGLSYIHSYRTNRKSVTMSVILTVTCRDPFWGNSFQPIKKLIIVAVASFMKEHFKLRVSNRLVRENIKTNMIIPESNQVSFEKKSF